MNRAVHSYVCLGRDVSHCCRLQSSRTWVDHVLLRGLATESLERSGHGVAEERQVHVARRVRCRSIPTTAATLAMKRRDDGTERYLVTACTQSLVPRSPPFCTLPTAARQQVTSQSTHEHAMVIRLFCTQTMAPRLLRTRGVPCRPQRERAEKITRCSFATPMRSCSPVCSALSP